MRGLALVMTGAVLFGVGPTPADAGMRRARDGDVAILEELCAARRAGTVAGYDLFMARHPEHRLAAVARAERSRLTGGSPAARSTTGTVRCPPHSSATVPPLG